MNLLIFGPPGAGKGTQAELLTKLGLYLIDIGSILRSEAETGTDRAKELAENMKNGRLNSDELINSVIENHLDKNNQWNNLLFDGYPRTLEQWSSLQSLLASRGKKVDAAIYLDISEDECVSRIENRILPKSTGKIFNIVSVPPPHDWPEEDLYTRNDSSKEALTVRFQQFHDITEKLVGEYEKHGILIRIDANNSISNIHDQVIFQLKERNLI